MKRWTAFAAITAVAALLYASAALADGTETLGTPSVSVSAGTGIVAAGTGMQAFPNLPTSFNVAVPGAVKQVLLYWEGHFSTPSGALVGDDSITVNGQPVTGTQIGGPTTFFHQNQGAFGDQAENYATYRADITGLHLVNSGPNTLTVNDMLFASNLPSGFPFTQGNDGVGVIVVYDDGSTAATIGVRDGLDLAYHAFAPPLDTTVPQTFSFAASAGPRTATLSTLAGSVLGPGVVAPRPDQLVISFAPVGAPIVLDSPWQSFAGPSWDALNSSVVIPAGATSMTVQALSAGSIGDPASLAWNAGALSVPGVTPPPPPPPPPPGANPLTPGYWKNHLAPVTSTCRPSNGCSNNGPWTSQYLPQSLGNYSVDTTAKVTAVFGAMNCSVAENCLAGHLLATKLNLANGSSTCISGTVAKADAFLKGQVVMGVTGVVYTGPSGSYSLTAAQSTLAISIKDTLDDYNNNGC